MSCVKVFKCAITLYLAVSEEEAVAATATAVAPPLPEFTAEIPPLPASIATAGSLPKSCTFTRGSPAAFLRAISDSTHPLSLICDPNSFTRDSNSSSWDGGGSSAEITEGGNGVGAVEEVEGSEADIIVLARQKSGCEARW